ncbi:MAG: two-component sensor histidine kinase [Deltaproteobacteria bacterium]|nr:two-component sensor histidine kinase [Deltaproteobacteria bacterium]MBW1738166.1 two-component sensor histidine kinase [Deltaproteobacteria bacterium]MBW1909785.1 two-component sensor histidine kinase [Deltaproteobacteria bacterium]MBW2033915.1 two-component sensor histidine kinase [Deltaproteobacteria bacterium]MBW2115460.1 two-component sensor histidine kinase [Deltaproteobacteria bacterium]
MDKSKETKTTDYPAFFRKRIFIIIAVSITPMILVSGIILYQFNRSYHEKVHAHLAELVLKHKQNIDGFLVEKLGNIRVLAKTFSFEELSDESFLRDRLEMLQRGYGPVFVDLGVINSQGLQVAYAGPFKLGKALYSTAGWFETAIKNEYVISDVFLGLRGLPHFIVTVRDNWKGESWIIRATIDFVAFNNLVGNIRVGETGFAFIMNREGELQTKPLFDVMPDKGPYLEFMKTKLKEKDDVQIVERKDAFGNKNIYVAAFLKGGDWLLVYQQRASDAFSDFRRALRVAFAIIILGGLAITSMAYLLSTRMAYRVARMDKERQMMDEQIVETGKLASVGELAAGIAHEINNPVAIMVEEAGWIEDLLEEEDFKEGKNLDEFERALKQIRTQGKRCKDITYKLLSFARKTDSRIQEVHLNDMLEELVAISAQRARYSNVTINTNFQSNLPLLEVSQSELQQVFLNLINNALDAMEKTGGKLEMSSKVEGDYVVVGVADNGPGIAKANLSRIFDPFFTTKQVGKGTGLGLSICYGIIKKMGGEIEVRSTVDVGTTFYVRIPLAKEKEKEEVVATT